MTTILCTNRKGGAGKTAIAVNIAAAYAQGTRTLLIDLDPPGGRLRLVGY